jgi:LPS-assembly protein
MGSMSRFAALLVGATMLAGLPATTASYAQTLTDRLSGETNANAKLYVELGAGSTSSYDRNQDVITLNGDVKLYYDGRVLEADRVVYDRRKKRVFAIGNARITEKDGTKYFADQFDITDDFRDGFVDHFRAVTTDNQRISAARAERSDGEQTVFEKGVYTPCLPCAADPTKAPLWQIKAPRMVAKNQEQMLYFENPYLEFWGVPVIGVPFFSMPDPSVRRKSGFLPPSIITDTDRGFGVSVPYFFALAPDYDLTVTPSVMSRQGLLLEAEWRQRLEAGSYNIAVAGIYQLDKDVFPVGLTGAGDLDFRGSIRSTGQFDINNKWKWGWAASVSTDRFFYEDYGIPTTGLSSITYASDSTSTAYLTGQGERSWFDLRGYYFQALTADAEQKQIPIVLPVLEYDRKFETPIGAELGVKINLLNEQRQETDLQQLTLTSTGSPDVGCLTSVSGNCSIIRGVAGSYSRFNTSITTKKAIVDPIGQVWTPFAAVDFSATTYWLENGGAFSANQDQLFGSNAEQVHMRVLPTIGLDYRYPFFAMTDMGSHVIEPIVQIVASPDEDEIGQLPNEDAQSLSFDDTNLFSWDKFSGQDRQEGGVRANVGIQYTWNLPNGGWVNMLGGRSFHLSGLNSFSVGDGANIGLDSGLERDDSDYVGRLIVQPNKNILMSLRGRFDPENAELKRIEALADFNFNRLSVNATYAWFAPQPYLGFDREREGLALNGSFKVTDNWRVFGGTVLDLDIGDTQRSLGRTEFTDKFQLAAASFGVGYGDECTEFTLSWARTNSIDTSGTSTTDDTFLVRLNLKNLGDIGYSYGGKPRVEQSGVIN